MADSMTTEATNKREALFSSNVLDDVHSRITRTGVVAYDRVINIGLGVTSMVKEISQVLTDLLSASGPLPGVTDSIIEESLCTIVKLRCLQLTSSLPKGVSAKDVPIPDFFRPFVSKIAKLDDPSRALRLVPVWSENCTGPTNGDSPSSDMTVTTEEFTDLRRVMRVLKVKGLKVTEGLPRELVTDRDDIFRVEETPSGELLVAGVDVSEADLLVRSVIAMQLAETVFGAARTRYISVEDLRPVLDQVVALGL